jgi:hypothetical protein
MEYNFKRRQYGDYRFGLECTTNWLFFSSSGFKKVAMGKGETSSKTGF